MIIPLNTLFENCYHIPSSKNGRPPLTEIEASLRDLDRKPLLPEITSPQARNFATIIWSVYLSQPIVA